MSNTDVPPLPPLPPRPQKAPKPAKQRSQRAPKQDGEQRPGSSQRLVLICAAVAVLGLAAVLFALFGGSLGSSTTKKPAASGPTPVSSDSVLVSALQTVLPSAVPEPTRTGVAHGSCNDFHDGATYQQEHTAVMRILGLDSATADAFIRAAVTAYCPAQATLLPTH